MVLLMHSRFGFVRYGKLPISFIQDSNLYLPFLACFDGEKADPPEHTTIEPEDGEKQCGWFKQLMDHLKEEARDEDEDKAGEDNEDDEKEDGEEEENEEDEKEDGEEEEGTKEVEVDEEEADDDNQFVIRPRVDKRRGLVDEIMERVNHMMTSHQEWCSEQFLSLGSRLSSVEADVKSLKGELQYVEKDDTINDGDANKDEEEEEKDGDAKKGDEEEKDDDGGDDKKERGDANKDDDEEEEKDGDAKKGDEEEKDDEVGYENKKGERNEEQEEQDEGEERKKEEKQKESEKGGDDNKKGGDGKQDEGEERKKGEKPIEGERMKVRVHQT
ncbi:spore wall protein 2-like [Euphorbia lathyris]|uniref:spore wall protein 2-like n=1 Tax=Euphorbia lathyris TaxID=212925 RepID=UPI003313FA00